MGPLAQLDLRAAPVLLLLDIAGLLQELLQDRLEALKNVNGQAGGFGRISAEGNRTGYSGTARVWEHSDRPQPSP